VVINEGITCRYCNEPLVEAEATKIGEFFGPESIFYMHKHHAEEHKESRRAFDRSERNCNTCIHLQRIKHEKCLSGFLQGKCLSTPINHPYVDRFVSYGNIVFHPNDPMHMECYEPRFPEKT
jgi:hypothetical protein